jgi:pimeloyl-ACP methyl ester carboxylesterase
VIRRHFPAARIDVIAGAEHNPHMDSRPEFVRLVREFSGR